MKLELDDCDDMSITVPVITGVDHERGVLTVEPKTIRRSDCAEGPSLAQLVFGPEVEAGTVENAEKL